MSAKRNLLVNTLPLLIICLAAVVGIYALGNFLEEKITRNKHMPIVAISGQVLPLDYDNDLPADRIRVSMSTYFGTEAAVNVYRARHGGEPVGLIFSPVRGRGYNGIVEMAVGVQYDGTLGGVRILEHRETPGLGDQVHQDNSPWILGFNGRSLANTPEAGWAVTKDGGIFDHISGATSSQRAVIRAVEHTLTYYTANRQTLYSGNSGQP